MQQFAVQTALQAINKNNIQHADARQRRPNKYAIENATTHLSAASNANNENRHTNEWKEDAKGRGGCQVSWRSFHLPVKGFKRLKANRSPKAAPPTSFI